MNTLTLDLPEALAHQLQKRNISEKELKAVLLATLELWLSQPEEAVARRSGRFAESAEPFIRRLITQNRELFETLAHR
jgi:hypothetical protein